MKCAARLLLLTFFSLAALVAQQVDSIAARPDSVSRIFPIPDAGRLEPFKTITQSFSDVDIIFTEYRSLYDILAVIPGVFVRDLASPGLQNQFVMNGIDDRNVAIMIDGIPVNDHYTGSFNLWNFPVDAIDRIEVMNGTGGLFYDGKSGGGAVNIVTKNFDNNRAVTRLRYSQGISGYTQTDAMFAQNIMTGLNLSAGLTHYGFGSNKETQNYRARFFNSNTDTWIFRTKVRYLAATWLNMTFSYLTDRAWTGLSGGVDYFHSPSIFDGLNADVKNQEAYQKSYNSHYAASATVFPYEDSVLIATVTLSSFERLREYRDEENRRIARNGIFRERDFASAGKGMNVLLLSQLDGLRLLGYTDFRRMQSKDIITAGVKSELAPLSIIDISPFATIKNYSSQFYAYGGFDAIIRMNQSIHFYGGMTHNILHDRQKILAGPASSFIYAERIQESYSLLEGGIRWWAAEGLSGSIGYRRTVEMNPVVFDTVSPISSFYDFAYFHPDRYTYEIFTAGIHASWKEFHLEGTGTYVTQPAIVRFGIPAQRYPEYWGQGSVYFHGLLADGNLDLKFGLRGTVFAEQNGMTPYDEFGVWIPSTDLAYGPGGSLDLFAIGKIGDAYVHLIWENLTGNQTLLAPVYPLYDRNIRFGVSWEFLD